MSAKRTRVKVSCEECGIIFKKVPSSIKGRIFCSRGCSSKAHSGPNNSSWVGGNVVTICANCSKEISVKPGNLKEENFCSRECSSVYKVGSKHSCWKGGLSTDKRVSTDYIKWRLNILKRDSFTCSKCNKSGGEVQVHHLLSFSRFPEARLAIDNGVTLCKACHTEFHRDYGTRKFTDEDYFEWLGEVTNG